MTSDLSGDVSQPTLTLYPRRYTGVFTYIHTCNRNHTHKRGLVMYIWASITLSHKGDTAHQTTKTAHLREQPPCTHKPTWHAPNSGLRTQDGFHNPAPERICSARATSPRSQERKGSGMLGVEGLEALRVWGVDHHMDPQTVKLFRQGRTMLRPRRHSQKNDQESCVDQGAQVLGDRRDIGCGKEARQPQSSKRQTRQMGSFQFSLVTLTSGCIYIYIYIYIFFLSICIYTCLQFRVSPTKGRPETTYRTEALKHHGRPAGAAKVGTPRCIVSH